jgi:putative ABC transport system permease protein
MGLAISLACTMVIGTWVYQEMSYERHYEDATDIYRVGINFYNIGDLSIAPGLLAPALTEYPEVESVTQVFYIGEIEIEIGQQTRMANKIYSTQKDYFEVFSHEFLAGSPEAFERPGTMVLTEDQAIEWFGTRDIIGEIVRYGKNRDPYEVVGVVKSVGKTHLPAEAWIAEKPQAPEQNWLSADPYTYVKLARGFTSVNLDMILDQILENDIKVQLAPDQDFLEWKQSGIYSFIPMRIVDIHLTSNMKFEPSPVGNRQTTEIFALVGLLILILAAINFINLSTARSSVRAKEVGIRKTLGTDRFQLIRQFIFESILVCLLSAVLAFFLGQFFLWGFESITNIELMEALYPNFWAPFVLFVLAILLGILAGIYPAFYLSRFKPVEVLKGGKSTRERGWFRGGLVIFQFTISISLLIAALFIYRQLNYMERKDPGFETENVLIIENVHRIEAQQEFFKQQVLDHNQVLNASLLQRSPAGSSVSVSTLRAGPDEPEIWAQQFAGDEDMIETLGYRLTSGRVFDKSRITDSSAIILNERAITDLGYKEPLGKTVNDRYQVIGTISDFNYESLKNEVEPVLLVVNQGVAYEMAIRFTGSNPEPLIDFLQEQWVSFGTDTDFNFYFMDEKYASLVEKEKLLSNAVGVFTLLAMIISCLGLYGLSAFTAERRTKEIGIRKALGASVVSITLLLSRQFAKPILVAFLVASPIVWYFIIGWLEDYAYRIDIDPFTFIICGIGALLIGWFTISQQSISTALQNPVDSLRDE